MKREEVQKDMDKPAAPSKKAGGEAPVAASAPLGDAEIAASLDNIALLKGRHREAERRFDERLAAKDKELEDLRARLRDLENRLIAARREAQDREQETTAIVGQSRAWAEEQVKVLQEMRAKHREELNRQREEENRLRARVEAQAEDREHLVSEWKGREQGLQARIAGLEASREQHKKELLEGASKIQGETEALRAQFQKELEASTARLRAEADSLRTELKKEREIAGGRFQTEMQASSERFQAELRRREAKLQDIAGLLEQERLGAAQRTQDFQKIVQEALSKLLTERNAYEELEESKARLEKDLAEARAEAGRIQSSWAEERKQWGELWEREQANRESRREELKRWESEMLREREALVRSLKENPQAGQEPRA